MRKSLAYPARDVFVVFLLLITQAWADQAHYLQGMAAAVLGALHRVCTPAGAESAEIWEAAATACQSRTGRKCHHTIDSGAANASLAYSPTWLCTPGHLEGDKREKLRAQSP